MGDGAQIEDAIIDKMPGLEKMYTLVPRVEEGWAENENIYIRDGVLVVTKNGVVSDGVRIGNA